MCREVLTREIIPRHTGSANSDPAVSACLRAKRGSKRHLICDGQGVRHTNLKRQVAVKVLPQTVAADPERLPLVTLADRISRAVAIPLDEALPIAMQMAEALEAVHEQGMPYY